tara:strand:- start:47263 stop:48297 length:1035 start_codon:yes stop_codon:yes gene_type:complete
MYSTISPQKLGDGYATSVADFVAYLEKENERLPAQEHEHFFNHDGDAYSRNEVIQDIDSNTTKLKKTEPRFYSLTLSPSQRELHHIQKDPKALQKYTKAVMEAYAKAFYREIEGKPVTIKDIKYYAKIEHQRSYKGSDKVIQENAPFHKKIIRLKNEIQEIKRGERKGSTAKKEREIKRLEKQAPHQLHGKRIQQGMAKEGAQSHIHIIVSRKDRSNHYSLSPGSQYKASEVVLHGKTVKRGFDRDQFFKASEKTFDTLFGYRRNYVETYQARKTLRKKPQQYLAKIMGLPTHEKAIAFQLLNKAGVQLPFKQLPTNKVQLVLKAVNYLKRGVAKAMESGSIGI